MSKKNTVIGFALSLLMAMNIFAQDVVTSGSDAPDFSLKGMDGKEYKLSDYRGKNVILEWYNQDCPFVRKHYDSSNMQKYQQQAKDQGVVWLVVNSSATGKQGHLTAESAKAAFAKEKMQASTLLLDSDGIVGKKYAAKTTPHLYLIGKDGKLLYQGAIDSTPSTDSADIAKSQNYLAPLLEKLSKGEAIEASSTKPYGCSVKY